MKDVIVNYVRIIWSCVSVKYKRIHPWFSGGTFWHDGSQDTWTAPYSCFHVFCQGSHGTLDPPLKNKFWLQKCFLTYIYVTCVLVAGTSSQWTTRAPMISTVKKLLASITTFLLTSMAGGATAASRGANVFLGLAPLGTCTSDQHTCQYYIAGARSSDLQHLPATNTHVAYI